MTRWTICFSAWIIILIFGMVQPTWAKPSVRIRMDPRVDTITIGADLQEVLLMTRTDRQNYQFEWELDGPGSLTGEKTAPGLIYVPPDHIDGGPAQVTVSVSIKDGENNTAKDEVTFRLLSPEKPALLPGIKVFDDDNQVLAPDYSVKRGETVRIEADLSDGVQIEWIPIRGKIEKTKDIGVVKYLPPEGKTIGKDIITLKTKHLSENLETRYFITITFID